MRGAGIRPVWAITRAVDADSVVVAVPIWPTERAVQVTYELREVEGGFSLQDALAPIMGG